MRQKTPLPSYAGAEFNLSIFVEGYEKVTKTVKAVNEAPYVDDPIWNEDTLSCILDISDYKYNKPDIYINGVKLKEKIDYLKNDDGTVEIFAENFEAANNQYSIVLKNNSYEDVELFVTTPESFVPPKQSPEITVEKAVLGNDITFNIAGNFNPWWESVTKITYTDGFNGGTAEKTLITKNNANIVFADNILTKAGKYTVTFYSKGYKNKSVEIEVLKDTDVIWEFIESEGIVLLSTKEHAYFSDDFEIYVNDIKLSEDKEYTIGGYSGKSLKIKAEIFAENDVNYLRIIKSGYDEHLVEIEKIILPKAAPEVEFVGNIMEDTNKIVISSNDNKWLEDISKENITIKKGSWSSVAISMAEYSENELTITSSSALKYGDYSIRIDVDGYRSVNLSFAVYSKSDVNENPTWDSEGNLLIKGNSKYNSFLYNISEVKVDGNVLTENESYKTSFSDGIKIYSSVFTEDKEYEIILICDRGSYKYLPVTLNVTKS